MKRVLFSVVGTVLGLVGLLTFKSHGPTKLTGAALPSAQLPGTTTTPAATPSTTTSAPPQPGPTATPTTSAPASSSGKSGSAVGQAIQTPYGIVQVKVTVAGGKITDVSFVQLTAFDGRSQMINQAAAPILLQQTLSAQSAQIDGVSGATYTSNGYVQSLQSALDQL